MWLWRFTTPPHPTTPHPTTRSFRPVPLLASRHALPTHPRARPPAARFATEPLTLSLPSLRPALQVLAIRGLQGTTLQVPDPDEGMEGDDRRYEMFLRSEKGAIDVYLISQLPNSSSIEHYEESSRGEPRPTALGPVIEPPTKVAGQAPGLSLSDGAEASSSGEGMASAHSFSSLSSAASMMPANGGASSSSSGMEPFQSPSRMHAHHSPAKLDPVSQG